MHYFTLWDIILLPFYLFIAYLVSYTIKQKYISSYPEYQYYISGLFAKFFGGISLCLIYVFYYKGGDTIAYYESAKAMVKLLSKNSSIFFSMLLGNNSFENYSFFDNQTGWPAFHIYKDPKAFSIVRFISPIMLLTFNSYLLTTIIVAWLSYTGVWKLYSLFCEHFPNYFKVFAITILFIPSVIFWGSGILKDSFTISATGWLIFSFYKIVLKKKGIIYYLLTSLISIYVLSSTKPYILISILFGLLVWIFFHYFTKIKSNFIRFLILPFLIIIILFFGKLVVEQIGSILGGHYASIDIMLRQAKIIQEDLKQEYYQGHSFDIGDFEPTIQGVFSKAPKAIIAGLYRPFIWECDTLIMLVSGLENLFFLLLSIFILLKVKSKTIYSTLTNNSLIMYSFVFSIALAFVIGLTTANFGALVRYRIPITPFFLSSLFILYMNHISKKKKEPLNI